MSAIRQKQSMRALLYWFKLQAMEDTRLPKECYLFQCVLTQRGVPCWASKIKRLLENLGLEDMWVNVPQSIHVFKSMCIEKLVETERDRWREKATQLPSLNALRVVKELTEVMRSRVIRKCIDGLS